MQYAWGNEKFCRILIGYLKRIDHTEDWLLVLRRIGHTTAWARSRAPTYVSL